jgi:carbamoyltransferase
MEIQLFQHHPIIGYTFIPNLKTRIEHEGGGYLLRTNAAGFRSEHEFSTAKTAGKFRVLLFGDSFTAGDAISNKNRFGDVLETLVPDVEVYNFGLPGTGTDQHYLVWREII